MKNRIKLFIMFLMSAVPLIFCSCSGKPSADDITFRIMNAYPSVPPCSQYVKYAAEHETGHISPEDFSYLYTGREERIPEWDLIEEFRIAVSDSTDFFEIHVIKVCSASDTDVVAKLIKRRADLIELYVKEENDYPARKPLLYVNGKYIILAATYDNDAALEVLDGIFKSLI